MKKYLLILSLSAFLAKCNSVSDQDNKEYKDSLDALSQAQAAAKSGDAIYVSMYGNFELSKSFFFLFQNRVDNSRFYSRLSINSKKDSSLCSYIDSPREVNEKAWSSRSYTTGFHMKDEVMDGDYGELVIQDFNFDGKEDIALKTDQSNAGAKYAFYLQQSFGKFNQDDFLTESISFLPTLDEKTKTVVVTTIAGASTIHEQKYSFNADKGWKIAVDTLIENQ